MWSFPRLINGIFKSLSKNCICVNVISSWASCNTRKLVVGWVLRLVTIKAFKKGIKILANGPECLLEHVWAKPSVGLMFGALTDKSSGVLEHAGSGSIRRWDPKLGVAWLSSCEIVRFGCSYCICSCLWVLVSMSPCTPVAHASWNFLHSSLMRIRCLKCVLQAEYCLNHC